MWFLVKLCLSFITRSFYIPLWEALLIHLNQALKSVVFVILIFNNILMFYMSIPFSLLLFCFVLRSRLFSFSPYQVCLLIPPASHPDPGAPSGWNPLGFHLRFYTGAQYRAVQNWFRISVSATIYPVRFVVKLFAPRFFADLCWTIFWRLWGRVPSFALPTGWSRCTQ